MEDEWAYPVHDDQLLFEYLMLEGAQAGLSWSTILNKRDNYRIAFKNFDIAAVSKFDAKKEQQLLQDKGIVRHAGKVRTALKNTHRYVHMF
jgi:DNA-3-methyladenine glycosylase I